MRWIRRKSLVLLSLVLFCQIVWAQGADIGAVSHSILGPLTAVSNLLRVGCYILGFGFIAFSFVRYVEHRRNPLQVRLTQVVVLLLLGLVLVGLPLIADYSSQTESLGRVKKAVKHNNRYYSNAYYTKENS